MKYNIKCPKCKSEFDCSEEIKSFKRDIINTSEILKVIDSLKSIKLKEVK